jgi:hypothetical protein
MNDMKAFLLEDSPMSYGLMVYAVDFEQVKEALGSGDDQIRRSICGRFKQRLAQLGEDSITPDDGFEAVRHLIMGGEKTLPAWLYGYAYECVVNFYGRALDNGCFMPCSHGYLEQLEEQLLRSGVKLGLMDFVYYHKALVELPSPDDFPGYSYWLPTVVQENLPILQSYEGKTEADRMVLSWLEYTASRGEGIVGFWY